MLILFLTTHTLPLITFCTHIILVNDGAHIGVISSEGKVNFDANH